MGSVYSAKIKVWAKECFTCKQRKTKYDFYRNTFRPDGLLENCKECHKKICKDKYSTVKGFLTHLNSVVKSRSKLIPYNLTANYLIGLYKEQKGFCALSGLKMQRLIGKGRKYNNISIDRIDPKLGYIKGNIQLVCDRFNIMKHLFSSEEFLSACETVVKHKANVVKE